MIHLPQMSVAYILPNVTVSDYITIHISVYCHMHVQEQPAHER